MDDNQVIDNAEQQANDEKLLSQSHVNKIVAHEKAKAAEAARREAEEKYQRDIEAARAMQEQRNANVSKDIDANAIYQQVQEKFNQEMQRRQQEAEQERIKAEMQNVANQYLTKIEAGKTAYEDFDEITKDFDPTAFPQLTFLIAGVENAADVLYDLAKNPLKLAGLDRLAEKNPRQAHAELLKLSASINANKQAQADAQSQMTDAPLDRLSPSRVSGSNGVMGVRDLRNQPWLKG